MPTKMKRNPGKQSRRKANWARAVRAAVLAAVVLAAVIFAASCSDADSLGDEAATEVQVGTPPLWSNGIGELMRLKCGICHQVPAGEVSPDGTPQTFDLNYYNAAAHPDGVPGANDPILVLGWINSGILRGPVGSIRKMPLEWKRVGVRPNNNPERRLAGAARFVARTASVGVSESLEAIWREECPPLTRRRKFEALFPGAQGFWATHCTWTGKRMQRPSAPLGPGRIRSIIGNIFVPAGLALARQRRDRLLEECVLDFFASLPQEAENKIQK
ncbi:MAG: DUF2851 family protein, partial [SAR324 cluster bacterium]|nr:DUF2851 family protein [SAR324 cluster bacterium]